MSEDPPLVLDEEAKRLKLEQAKAEARKAIVEAQKATLAAQLPAYDVKPLEGKTEVGTGVGLVAQLLAYNLLGPAADTIFKGIEKQLGAPNASVLVVEDRLLAARDWTYESIEEELKAHTEALALAIAMFEEKPPKPPPIPEPPAAYRQFIPPAVIVAAAEPIINAAAGIIGMFRTDYSITSKEFTIGATPLVAAVTHRLLEAKKKVAVDQFALLRDSRVIREFREAWKTRVTLEQRGQLLKSTVVQPADRRLEDLRAEAKEFASAYAKRLGDKDSPANIKELKETLDDLTASIRKEEQESGTARGLAAMVDSVVARFDGFVTAVTTTAQGGTHPPIVAAALREQLHGDKATVTHVLYVGGETSGGETITRKGYFVKSGRAAFMGGVQVSYLLLDIAANRTVAAGTESLLGHLQYDVGKGRAGPPQKVDFKLS